MKKIMISLSIALIVFSIDSQAQRSKKAQMQIESWSWGATGTQGSQTVPVPGGKGTITFSKQGDTFSNVIFTDAAGVMHRMMVADPSAKDTKTSCKYPLPGACFATSDKSIGMCVCKPNNLSANNGGDYLLTLSTPMREDKVKPKPGS